MGEVKITIIADDKSAPALEQFARNVEAAGNRAQSASRGMQDWSRAALTISNGFERSMMVMTRLDLVQISLDQSQRRLRDSQQAYNQAVLEFGPASRQALAAKEALRDAQDSAEKANLRAKLSYALVGGELANMAAHIPKAIQSLQALRMAQMAAATSSAALNVAMTSGAAAVGIAAGLYTVAAAVRSVGDSYTYAAAGAKTFDEQQMALQNRLRATPFGAERARILEEIGAIQDARESMRIGLEQNVTNWQRAEALRALITTGNEQLIREQLDQTQAKREELLALSIDAANPWSQYDPEEGQAAWQQFLANSEQATVLGEALAQLEQNGVRAMEMLARSVSSAIPGFDNLSIAMQKSIATSVGFDQQLIPSVSRLTELEKILPQVSGEARRAILEQAAAVKDKSGDMTLLNELLDQNVITEEEAAQAATDAANAYNRQAGAATNVVQAFTPWGHAGGGSAGTFSGVGDTGAKDHRSWGYDDAPGTITTAQGGKGKYGNIPAPAMSTELPWVGGSHGWTGIKGGPTLASTEEHETRKQRAEWDARRQAAFDPLAMLADVQGIDHGQLVRDFFASQVPVPGSLREGGGYAAGAIKDITTIGNGPQLIRRIDSGANYGAHVSPAQFYSEELQNLLSMKPSKANDPKVQAALEYLSRNRSDVSAYLKKNGLRDQVLKILAAANGFDDIVRSPTLMLVGEAGPEHVTVEPTKRPSGRSGSGASLSISIVQHFHGRADASQVRSATADGIEIAATRFGLRRDH